MQSLVLWSDDLSVGIQEIDEQHKILVDLLNELHTAVCEHKGSSVCRSILDRLVEYTRVHFAVEESLMRILGFPGHDDHKHEHELLTQQVFDLLHKLDSGKTAISFELFHFLKIWLTKHIQEGDKQYARYFLERNVQRTWEKKRSWKFW